MTWRLSGGNPDEATTLYRQRVCDLLNEKGWDSWEREIRPVAWEHPNNSYEKPLTHRHGFYKILPDGTFISIEHDNFLMCVAYELNQMLSIKSEETVDEDC